MDADNQPRVVEEPRRSLLPYVALGAVAAVVAWSIWQPSVDEPSHTTVISAYHPPATPKRRSNEASGDVRAIFNADDYPASAQRNGQQGTVQASLTVNKRGRVSDCRIVRSSGVPALDETTCSILRRRARFAPAHDSGGRRIVSTVTTPPIVWRLEG